MGLESCNSKFHPAVFELGLPNLHALRRLEIRAHYNQMVKFHLQEARMLESTLVVKIDEIENRRVLAVLIGGLETRLKSRAFGLENAREIEFLF